LKLVNTDTSEAPYIPVKVVVEPGEVEVQGFQMNTSKAEGSVSEFNPSFRVISKASNIIEYNGVLYPVVGYGLVYAKNDDVKSDYSVMVEGGSDKVNTVTATGVGLISGFTTKDKEEDTSKFFAVTFKHTNYQYNTLEQETAVRAYAILSDGTKVYGTKVFATSIYKIAQNLYDNRMMGTREGHDFLYDNVLGLVSLKNNRASIVRAMYTALNIKSTADDGYSEISAMFTDIFNYVTQKKGTVYYNTYTTRGEFRMSDSGTEASLLDKLNSSSETPTTYSSVYEWIYNKVPENGLYRKVEYDWNNAIYDEFDEE
jgi:hypothetical protein